MNPRTFKDDFLLLLTAAIWGFAFVAQRAGAGLALTGLYLLSVTRGVTIARGGVLVLLSALF
jgi:hypothetical protein